MTYQKSNHSNSQGNCVEVMKTCKVCAENNTLELGEKNHCTYCHNGYKDYIVHLGTCEPFKKEWAKTGNPPPKPSDPEKGN